MGARAVRACSLFEQAMCQVSPRRCELGAPGFSATATARRPAGLGRGWKLMRALESEGLERFYVGPSIEEIYTEGVP